MFVTTDEYKHAPDKWLPAWLHLGRDSDGGGDGDVAIQFVHTRGMTKFERTAIVAHRASQIAQGSQPRALVKTITGEMSDPGTTDPIVSAAAEIDAGVIDGFDVFRHMPDGTQVVKNVKLLGQARRRIRLW